jgi:peptidoglycan/LPS O-acetylase OafA/YrhL
VASFAYKLLVLALADPRVGPLEPGLIALPAFLDHFALGMGLAVLEVRGVRLGRAPWAWWAAAAGLFVLAAVGLRDARLDSYTHAEWLARHTLYGLTAVAFLVPVVAGAGGPARVLRAWPLRKLGEISYGVYLYHLVVLALLSRWGLVRWEGPIHPYVLWTGFGLAGSVLLATLSWRLVERPLLRLRPWAGRAGRPAPAPRA